MVAALNCRSMCRPERVNLLDLRSASTFDATVEGVRFGGDGVSDTVTTDSPSLTLSPLSCGSVLTFGEYTFGQ